jgi:hypothetical protein
MNKFPLAALVLVAALAVGACGSSSTTAPAHQAAAATPPPALTNAQGASICNDLNAWWKVAYNEDMPRPPATS